MTYAPHCPEEVSIVVLVDCQEGTVGGDDLHGHNLIRTQAIEAGQWAMSATRYPASHAYIWI